MAYVTEKFDGTIIRLLKAGKAGLLPTDTIYGLSAAALNEKAVNKVRRLKSRDMKKPFIILVSDTRMLDLLSIPKQEVKPAEKYWPGQLTIICSAPKAPAWLHQGKYSLAIRQPAHEILIKLIDKTGPLISTSANYSGAEPLKSAKEAIRVFGDKLDFYVDTGELKSQPSTIVINTRGRLQVIRQGLVQVEDLS